MLDVVFPIFCLQILVSTAVRTVYHACDERYDCDRNEYAQIGPHITPTPQNGTVHDTLFVSIRVRIPMLLEAFTIDQRLKFREAVSGLFRVPLFLVSIKDIAEGGAEGDAEGAFLDITGIVGEDNMIACAVVPCETVSMQPQDQLTMMLLSELVGATFIVLPTCKVCQAENEFVFASAGTWDDPFSCGRQCAAGFFQFRGLDTASCEPHSQPLCAAGQFLREGTSSSDASCVNCSTCEGARFVAECSAQTDTVCEECADAGPRQHWIGDSCSPACDAGFVWDKRTQELCEPGLQTPVQQDNCSHCVACPPHPTNAHWSAQDDRFDCMWLCDELFELSGLGCVARPTAVDTLVLLQPVCDPGHLSVNFVCVPCFEAATTGHLSLRDLPLPAELHIKWQWFYGCQWRCMHAAGFWELRADSGLYWECASTKQHTIMLRGIDMSWAAGTESNTTPTTPPTPTGLRREAAAENSTLLRTVLVLIAVPVLVLVCTVLVSVAGLCIGTTALSDETQPLL